jgi:hypothetical protein
MRKVLAFAIVTFAAAIPMRLLSAPAQERPLDPLVISWDKGADKIDTSKYPAEIKRKYKVFEDICARCHTLARAVNCDFALEDDWERYIKRMMRRGRGLVTPEEAQDAFDFAVYDSKIRKRALYERKLKEAANR